MSSNMVKKLSLIQSQLKAPKNQRNNFGGYNYRSAEDILEAVKPLALEHGVTVQLSDEIIEVGGRVYVKATCTITNVEDSNDTMQTSACAREEETKKGMDGSQITGAASSYARKYALNGMFAIDDTKDSDATNDHGKNAAPAKKGASEILGGGSAPAKPKPNAKYVEAWKAYSSCEANADVPADKLKEGFKNLCIEAVGNKDPRTFTDGDWDKVIAAVANFSDIPF